MKGQHEALSAILITGILIGVVGSVYFWGMPLIEKNKDISILKNAEEFMKNLNEKIKYVANHGGRDQIEITVPGVLAFDGQDLLFEVETTGTIYAVGSWIPITKNACTLAEGKWGIQESEVLCILAECMGDINDCEEYKTAYKLSYIPLNVYDPLDELIILNSYQIELNGQPEKGSLDHSVVIENLGPVSNGNLIKTRISINIV